MCQENEVLLPCEGRDHQEALIHKGPLYKDFVGVPSLLGKKIKRIIPY